MQRVAPILVLILFVVALVVAVAPVPRFWEDDGGDIEVKLGLDLVGGLRGEDLLDRPTGLLGQTEIERM